MSGEELLEEVLEIKDPKDSIYKLLGAGLSPGLPFLLGLLTGNLKFGTLGALGAFAYLSYAPLPLAYLGLRVLKAGIGITVAVYLGLLSTLLPWTIPLAIGGVSFAGLFLARLFKLPSPGAFFMIMVCCMATGMKVSFAEMLPVIGYVSLGVASAVLTALGVGYLNITVLKQSVSVPPRKLSVKARIRDALQHDEALLLSPFHHATIIALAAYIGPSLGLVNPYWITISTAAVLVGGELKEVFFRHAQRLVGGIVGLLIGSYLLSQGLSTVAVVAVVIGLYVCVEYTMARNYGLANFFTNPLALMLANLSGGLYVSDLLLYRFYGLFLGGVIALLGSVLIELSMKRYERRARLR